jgi:hypothetical protein
MCRSIHYATAKTNYFVLVVGQLLSYGSARCDKQRLHQRTSTDTPRCSYTSRGDADEICPKHTQVCSDFCASVNLVYVLGEIGVQFSLCVCNQDLSPTNPTSSSRCWSERCTRGERSPSPRGWDPSSSERDDRSCNKLIS